MNTPKSVGWDHKEQCFIVIIVKWINKIKDVSACVLFNSELLRRNSSLPTRHINWTYLISNGDLDSGFLKPLSQAEQLLLGLPRRGAPGPRPPPTCRAPRSHALPLTEAVWTYLAFWVFCLCGRRIKDKAVITTKDNVLLHSTGGVSGLLKSRENEWGCQRVTTYLPVLEE